MNQSAPLGIDYITWPNKYPIWAFNLKQSTQSLFMLFFQKFCFRQVLYKDRSEFMDMIFSMSLSLCTSIYSDHKFVISSDPAINFSSGISAKNPTPRLQEHYMLKKITAKIKISFFMVCLS